MTSSKKAQSAVEYLQTYGWAILVILVVGIAIWQLGILGREKVNVASGFEKIKVLDASIKYKENMKTDALYFSVANTLGTRIKLKISNMSGDCKRAWFNHQDISSTISGFNNQTACESHWDCYWLGDACRCQIETTLNPGETKQIEYSSCEPLYSGENFGVYLRFRYRIKLGAEKIWREDGGYIRGYAE